VSNLAELKLLRERYEYWLNDYNRTGSVQSGMLYRDRFKTYCGYIDQHKVARSDVERLMPSPSSEKSSSSPPPMIELWTNNEENIDRKEWSARQTDKRVFTALVQHNDFIGVQELSHTLGLSVDNIRYSMSRLLALGKVERSDSPGGGKYLWKAKQ
jgi:hypothetical protein